MAHDPNPITIQAAAAAMQAGTLTPVALLDHCLARIDHYEPHVRAWVVVDREGAREQAERLSQELANGQYRGPLHGIPVGIKDIIDVFDLPTGCGSRLWANSIARQDATVVRKLRQVGAIILGKTVTTAHAFLDPAVTRNPWNLSRTPGGSSSGSAAAVACGMCLGALGTQTGGSLTRPAAFCGVCSFKPNYIRVSRDGVLPLAPTLDHVGVMANCVTDLAILFQAIAGPANDRDAATRWSAAPDCLETIRLQLGPQSPGPPRFGRLRGMFDELAAPEIRAFMGQVQSELRSQDALVEDIVPPASFAEVLSRHRQIMAVEAAEHHHRRFRRVPDDYPPKIRELIEEGLATSAVDYRQSRVHRDEMGFEMDHNVGLGLQVLMTPATVELPPDRSSTGNASMNSPWSFTGNPTLSLPIGRSESGPPPSIQLVGHLDQEATLLAIGAWCEQKLGCARTLPAVDSI